MSPGLTIRNARLKAGLTQAELASRMGTTQSAVARLESGTGNPSYRTIEDALSAAGWTIKRLELERRPAGVDESLIVAQLKLTPRQRLDSLESMYKQAKFFAEAGRRHRERLA